VSTPPPTPVTAIATAIRNPARTSMSHLRVNV
jgi:hypothetical protein